MKRVVAIFLCTVLVLSVSGCGMFNKDTASKMSSSSALPPSSMPISSEPTPEIDITEEQITITLPAFLFQGGYDLNLEDVSSEDITKNADGSYTVVLNKEKYLRLVEDYKGETEKIFAQFSDTFPSIESITSSEDMTEITVSVDRAAFEQGLDSVALVGLSMGALTYQAITGAGNEQTKVTVNVKDKSTNEVFLTRTYPEAFGGSPQ